MSIWKLQLQLIILVAAALFLVVLLHIVVFWLDKWHHSIPSSTLPQCCAS